MNVTFRDYSATLRAQYSIRERLPSADAQSTQTITTPFREAQLTQAQKAEIDQRQKTWADASAQVKASIAEVKANRAGSGIQLGDVSKFSEHQARGALVVVEKLQSMRGWRNMAVSVSNGSETTTSLDTLADWLRAKTGNAAGDPSHVKSGAIVNLSA